MYFGASNVTAQFQLNGSLTPGFPANAPEWLEISRNAVEKNGGEIPVRKRGIIGVLESRNALRRK